MHWASSGTIGWGRELAFAKVRKPAEVPFTKLCVHQCGHTFAPTLIPFVGKILVLCCFCFSVPHRVKFQFTFVTFIYIKYEYSMEK